MSNADSSIQSTRLREHAERNLGALVVAIEFTLISVMVGVVLFPLMDFATPILKDLKFEYWLYIVSGLALILYLWTEVISHSLTFIGWPIDIPHNLLYIVFAMFLAIQMHFLADPRSWFGITIVTATVGAIVVYYDHKVIADRMRGARGAAADLYSSALRRQDQLVRTTPFTILNAIIQFGLILLFPTFFIDDHGHLILIAIQAAAFIFLTVRTIRAFKATREKIVFKAIEELSEEK